MAKRDSIPPVDPADAGRKLQPRGTTGPGDTGELQERPGGQGIQLEGPLGGPLGQEPPGLRLDPRTQILEDRASGRIRRVALVLEGGGALGAFQLGVLKNLFDRGLDPLIVTGTSVGALNAAKVAEGRGRAGVEELEELWDSIENEGSIFEDNPLLESFSNEVLEDWKGWALAGFVWTFMNGLPWIAAAEFPGLVGATIGNFLIELNAIESFMLQDPLIDLVEENIDLRRVFNSGIRLRLAAVTRDGGEVRYFTEHGDIETEDGLLVKMGRRDNPDTGERIDNPVVNRGDELKAPNLADGVIASSAIPLVFKPWLIQGGEYYWDAAVREGVPIRKALELGATDMVVVLTGNGPWADPPEFAPSRYALVIERVHQIDNPEGISGRKGDFFVQLRVGHGDWQRSPVREDDDNFYPHWTFPDVFGDVAIRVYDDEGDRDRCDVCPERGRTELRIWFDGETISGDVEGKVGDLIHARGSGDADRVEIWLRIVSWESGSSYADILPEAINVTPLIRMLQAMGQMQKEVKLEDFAVLDTLDILHEMAADLGEGNVLRSLNSQDLFPLPRDLQRKAYALPRYTVIEAPVRLGSVLDFDRDTIHLNMALGELTAKYTRVGFLDALEAPRLGNQYVHITQDPELSNEYLEQLKKSAIISFLDGEVTRWQDFEDRGGEFGEHARKMRKLLQRKLEWYREAHIVPTRRSASQTLPLP